MKNLVLFGDSLLGRFGKDLIVDLETKVPGLKVYNCAAGGQNSKDGVDHVDYIAKLKPDYVVICFGSNDAAPWKKQIEISEYQENMSKILESFDESLVIGFPCPPANDPNDPNGTKEFNNLLREYNEAFKKVCESKSAQYIEVDKIFGELLKNGNDYHMGDGIHLDKLGYGVFIDKLVELIS
jgi:lysophospholipase L1-like esterase